MLEEDQARAWQGTEEKCMMCLGLHHLFSAGWLCSQSSGTREYKWLMHVLYSSGPSLLHSYSISGSRKPSAFSEESKGKDNQEEFNSLGCNFCTFMTKSCNVYSFFPIFSGKGYTSASQGFVSNADTFLQQLPLNNIYFSSSFHNEVRIHRKGTYEIFCLWF